MYNLNIAIYKDRIYKLFNIIDYLERFSQNNLKKYENIF